MPRSRCLLALLLALPLAAQSQRAYRPDMAQLQRILVAEDARGAGTDGIKPLVDGLASSDSMIRRVSVRAIGRLQRPDLARQLVAKLEDRVPAVRAEAANSIAQSVVRARRLPTDSLQPDVKWAAGVLAEAIGTEKNSFVQEALAEAVGRLAFGDSETAKVAERAILSLGEPGFGAVHGLYWLAANRQTTGGLSADAIGRLRIASTVRAPVDLPSGLWIAMPRPTDPATRRVAVLALTPVNGLDSATMVRLQEDPDEQVRRLALGGIRPLSATSRAEIVKRAFADKSPIVRIAAVTAARVGLQRPDCSAIVAATSDPMPYVQLAAIDALATPCSDSANVAAVLGAKLNAPDARGGEQARAHALVSLARVDPARARPATKTFAAAPQQIRRLYAARAAEILRDTTVLMRLAGDRDNNVREAAIGGLAATMRHGADSVFIAALASPGYQVVLEAANSLSGSQHPGALNTLLTAFDRLSAQKRENAKDPRVAVLRRISEMGSPSNVTRLQPYLADFDTTIAASVATTLTKWMGTPVTATPRRLAIQSEPLARTFLAKNVLLRVTMAPRSGGGTFTIRLFTEEAPATAARIIRLARTHFYDGHVFQRVEPNFVVQGGGPDASEYVGDRQFMRDEVAFHSHFRGTLGISSRGRDTGDGQWFFNLIDNTRLDHEYTVFGELVSGQAVAERILEGDVIARVVVVGGP